MKPAAPILVAIGLAGVAAAAGTIVGTVHAVGKAGAEADLPAGAYASRKYKFAERVDYDSWRDFVVYLDQPLPGAVSPPAVPARVVQQGAAFSPHVLPILVGTTVEWPNHDEIFHNVFSDSEIKPFDLGLYKKEIKRVTFDRPGRVDVFCSIHSKMHCIILVLPNPYFATTDARGRYRLGPLPAGTYRLKAWHDRLPAEVQTVHVPAAGEVRVDLTLGLKNLPAY